MVCIGCHESKRKCDKDAPCSRCVKLGIPCIPHLSQQGKRKRGSPDEIPEDVTILRQVSLPKDHYGLCHLIRSWISIAFVRRSFPLLHKATTMANQLGVTMDEIMSRSMTQQGMHWMGPIVATPHSEQMAGGPRLQWSELPESLLVATRTLHSVDCELRWIWIREMSHGRSRYLVTQAFERDIATWALVQSTWNENRVSVVDLFLDGTGREKHAKSVAHQYSLHAKPPTPHSARCSRQRSQVKLRSGDMIAVEEVSCMVFVHMDLSYHFVEYVPVCMQQQQQPQQLMRSPVPVQRTVQNPQSVFQEMSKVMWDDYPLMVNVDDIPAEGNELDQILQLLNGG